MPGKLDVAACLARRALPGDGAARHSRDVEKWPWELRSALQCGAFLTQRGMQPSDLAAFFGAANSIVADRLTISGYDLLNAYAVGFLNFPSAALAWKGRGPAMQKTMAQWQDAFARAAMSVALL